MKIKSDILNALFFWSAFFLLIPLGYGQEYVELLEGSEQITHDGKSGTYFIKGNVTFKKDLSTVYCDSAYFSDRTETIWAYSNIHLNKQDTLNMFCDSLFFDTKKNLVKLYGKVRIRTDEYKLETDSLDYDLNKDVGIYRNGGEITSISSSDHLTSTIGYMYPNKQRFNFRKDVIYKNEDYVVTTDTLEFDGKRKIAYFFGPTTIIHDSITMYCEDGWYDMENEKGVLEKKAFLQQKEVSVKADSIYFSQIDSIYIAEKKVHIIDTINKVGFEGDYVYNNDKIGNSFITGHALAKRFGEEDTLYIHADTLFNFTEKQKPTLMLAYKKVKLFRGDMQGICDSLVYDRSNGVMTLFTEPILWAREAQLSGDTITVFEKNDKIQRAFIRKEGLVVTKLDSIDYYNQISGTFMNAYFDSTEIKRVDIEANAKTVYFPEDEEKSDNLLIVTRKGMNRLYASNITLRFSKGDIETATYREQPDGKIYPMMQINQEEKLVEHFKWAIEKRPRSQIAIKYSNEELEVFKLIFRQISGMI